MRKFNQFRRRQQPGSDLVYLWNQFSKPVYSSFEGAMGEDGARQIERNLMLRAIDENWVQHLTSMENLRQGIGLQAVGQRDPLVMYKKEGHDLFQGLQEKISSDVIHSLFRLRPEDLFSISELQIDIYY